MYICVDGINLPALWEACKAQVGVNNALHKMQEMLGGLLMEQDGKAAEFAPGDFSLKEMYDFCRFTEDVGVHQFPILASTLISKRVMDAYDRATDVGDQLVTNFPSSLQIDKITGAFTKGNLADIEPGSPFEHTGDIEEKYVQIEGKKRGAILDVTWEAVKFDQTGQVMREADKFGQRMAVDKESRIMNYVQDIAGSRCYYPTNTQTNLYQAAGAARHTYGNLISDALQNWRDIDAAYQALALMKDDNADPINIRPKILLVPIALETTAKRLINNTLLPATRSGSGNVGDNPNESNPWANSFKVISSSYLDAQSSVVWYLGDFKEQFLWKEVIAPEIITRKDNKNDPAFERDIVAQYKLRYYGIVGAVDYRYVCKSNGTMGQCEHDSVCGAGSFA